jgi:beta-mannosidase
LAQWVHIEDESFRAEDDWFHLPPGQERRVRLIPFGHAAAAPEVPEGEVRALNLAGAVSYRSRA